MKLFQPKKTSSAGQGGGSGFFGKSLINGATSVGLRAGETVGKGVLAVGSTGVKTVTTVGTTGLNVAATGFHAVEHVAETGVNTIVKTASGNKGYLNKPKSSKKVSSMDIFCSDFYTEEFILNQLEQVRVDANVVTLNFEDMILRECPKIYNKATELLMETAATFEELLEGEDPDNMSTSFRMGGSSSRRLSSSRTRDGSLRRSSGMGMDDSSKKSNSSSRRTSGNSKRGSGKGIMDSSWHAVFGGGDKGGSSRSFEPEEAEAAARLWKLVTFTDAVSDADDYLRFVAAKAAFQKRLMLKNMTTKVPIKFIAKIELHNMMSVEDVFELLQEIEKDDHITNIDFRGFEGNAKKIPSEFVESFDVEAGEWKEGAVPIEIMLYYGKEDMSVNTKGDKDKKKKKITVDVIRRCRMKLLDTCPDTDSESEDESEEVPPETIKKTKKSSKEGKKKSKKSSGATGSSKRSHRAPPAVVQNLREPLRL